MPFVYQKRDLRQVLPRREIRERDQRPGAYPVKSKTGDRTRTGRNNVYFDDGRTVKFRTASLVTYPTTLQFDKRWVGADLTSSLGYVTGAVDKFAVDQWILPHDQVEAPGPFFDTGLFEQDETNVVNSQFMTGVAYGIAPDRFKSKLSDKTIVRMEFPIHVATTLQHVSSAIHYLNPKGRTFDLVTLEQSAIDTSNVSLTSPVPGDAMAYLPFTPYGHFALPLRVYEPDTGIDDNSTDLGLVNEEYAKMLAIRGVQTVPDDPTDDAVATISTINPNHNASGSQLIDVSSFLSAPFLLEKMVVELPFQAGPGWLNDRFGIREVGQQNHENNRAIDLGGPMITCALFRQDEDNYEQRDLIASASFTTALDVVTGTYFNCTHSYTFDGSPKLDDYWTQEGVYRLSTPNATVMGNVLSGANNFFTGTVKLTMEPAVTNHVWRISTSGSVRSMDYYGPIIPINSNTSFGNAQIRRVVGNAWSPSGRRSNSHIESSRNVLGNQFTFLDVAKIVPNVLKSDTGLDKLPINSVTGSLAVYTDVVSSTKKSPYLLYPSDKLILCLNKHRAVGSKEYTDWEFDNNSASPFGPIFVPKKRVSEHDCAVPAGVVRVTLYGDLLREDAEFHDTLNQRLETEEIWEEIGEDPVLDQFDVAYRHELSGTYVDRFNVINTANIAQLGSVLTSSKETTQYYSNFSQTGNSTTPWSTKYQWTSARSVDELKGSSRNVSHFSTNERFWDSHIPDIYEVINFVNPNVRLAGYDSLGPFANFILYTGTSYNSGTPDRGVRDWAMTYPYEGKYSGLSQVYSDKIDKVRRLFQAQLAGGSHVSTSLITYGQINYVVGDDNVHRYRGGESTDPGGFGLQLGMTFPEFVKAFYGIGDGYSSTDNQFTTFMAGVPGAIAYQGVQLRGWRYGMRSAFVERSRSVFRRDRFGQPRDMLEQRLDTKFFDELGLSSDGNLGAAVGVKTGPVQVAFYDAAGNVTDALKTLSSNVSVEATSSVPYTDGLFRNRPAFDASQLNITRVVV